MILNGIDGATGDYYTPAVSDAEAAAYVTGNRETPQTLNRVRSLYRDATQPHFGLAWNLDPKNLSDSGWAIVFAQNENPAVRSALDPLIQRRMASIGKPECVKVLEYRPGETTTAWLARYGVAPGSIDPVKSVPFYVLLVGGPETISFEFSNLLSIEYCVGRLSFDAAEDYAAYAASVVAYETAPARPTSDRVVFWAPRHQNADDPTQASADLLVRPLAKGSDDGPPLVEMVKKRSDASYSVQYFEPPESTKPALTSVFRGEGGTPAFLFTASHGLGWPIGHPQQLPATGALVCNEFPGRGLGQLTTDTYFTAGDLPSDANVHGMIAFHFACFGAGSPQYDRYFRKAGQPMRTIAPQPFFSALPKALLSHRNGGALAVIGHVERAWLTSIRPDGASPQLQPFQNAIGGTLSGLPVGYALRSFNERYAALSTNLAAMLEKRDFGLNISDADLVDRWRDRNDAEGYLLLGDPGVQIHRALRPSA